MKATRLLTCLLGFGPLMALPSLAADTAAKPVDPAYHWDLSLVYKDEAAFQAARAKLSAELPKMDAFKGHLGDNAKTLKEAFDLYYSLRKELSRMGGYASNTLNENQKISASLERAQELDMLASDFSQKLSWIAPELIAVGEAKIKAFIAQEPGLKTYAFGLEETLRSAPHILGAEAEGVLSASGMVTDTPSTVYSILTNADMPWPTIKLSDGTEARLDASGYSKYRAIPNRADREAVFHAFWGKYKEFERSLGVTLFSQVKADWYQASTRKYKSCLEAALSNDNIPEAVYRTLLSETNANLPTLHRYFKLRGRMLGISDLKYSDIYPSIVNLKKEYTYDQAKGMIIDATKPLGADYTSLITDCLSKRYTDVYPQPGKRSGAYMDPSMYDVHAFVLLNFHDDYESVSTTAHEWGHGCHTQLATANQPFATANYSIFVAEIASTLNEALLFDYTMKGAKTDEEKLFFLGNYLERLRATFFRQAMFAEFELATHEEVEKGGALSGAKLNKIYGDILRRYHGHDKGVMNIDDEVTREWAYIPHFYTSFYVYQYATSISASQAFADKILSGEKGAVDTYLGMLKAGGSANPYELVKKAGVDLATPAPYKALVTRMNSIMDQIEAILDKQKK